HVFPPIETTSDVSLLSGLLVAGIENCVDHDRGQKNDALDDILDRVLDVHDRHAIEQDANKKCPDDHVADSAAPAGKTDTAEHHHKDHIVDVGRDRDAGVHAGHRASGHDPGYEPYQRGEYILQNDDRPRRNAGNARRLQVVTHRE